MYFDNKHIVNILIKGILPYISPRDLVNLAYTNKTIFKSVKENLIYLSDEKINKLFEYCIEFHVCSMVKILLKDGKADPTYNNHYPVCATAEDGKLKMMKLLLNDKRVDPSANNNEAIQSASARGYLPMIKELLKDRRVDPSANNNCAIRWVYQKKNIIAA